MPPRYQPAIGRQPSDLLAAAITGSFYFWSGLNIPGGNDTEIFLLNLDWNGALVPNQVGIATIDKTQANPTWIKRIVGAVVVYPDSVNVDANGSLAITWPDVPIIGELHFIDANAGGFFAGMIPGTIPCHAETLA